MAEYSHGRVSLDVVCRTHLTVTCTVHLGKPYGRCILGVLFVDDFCCLFPCRSQLLAPAAPRCKEVDEDYRMLFQEERECLFIKIHSMCFVQMSVDLFVLHFVPVINDPSRHELLVLVESLLGDGFGQVEPSVSHDIGDVQRRELAGEPRKGDVEVDTQKISVLAVFHHHFVFRPHLQEAPEFQHHKGHDASSCQEGHRGTCDSGFGEIFGHFAVEIHPLDRLEQRPPRRHLRAHKWFLSELSCGSPRISPQDAFNTSDPKTSQGRPTPSFPAPFLIPRAMEDGPTTRTEEGRPTRVRRPSGQCIRNRCHAIGVRDDEGRRRAHECE
mmetsp:Transcript_6438/g.40238  ORF Transcript_6438/g.40238 Transcript_6438/m.40238 type:complete len:327 (-) Transcript_6438:156-1136(-)